MKHFLTLAALVSPLLGSAQAITNDGATITVQAGTMLYVEGSLQNKAGSTMTNAGTVQLTGGLTNAGTLASAGTLLFSGSSNQTFAPGPAPTVATLVVDKGGAVGQNVLSIPADLTISASLSLLNGLVRTASATAITLPDGANVTGEAPGRYVQGNLRVIRANVSGSAPVTFPNSASLNPNGQNLGTVTITRTAGLQTAGVSQGQNLAGTNRGIDRVWNVAATGVQPSAATPATAVLSWLADDDNGFVLSANAQLWRAPSAAGPWGKLGAPASAAGRSFAAEVAQLGTLTVSNVSAPLPVELTRFTAEPQGDDALLKWATASEKNNDHFDVEASADGKVFRRVGTVAGHGTSTQASEYHLTDKAIARYAADPVYYRLRQVDADGTATYSPVRTVRVKVLADFTAQLYPNPSRSGEAPSLLVRTPLAGPLHWELTDALGRTVLGQTEEVTAGSSALLLGQLADLTTGVYVLRVQLGSYHQALKLVRE